MPSALTRTFVHRAVGAVARIALPPALLLVLLIAPLAAQPPARPSNAGWTKGAVCYEIFVRSFRDSDGDGIGDLKGLTESLDYINDGNPSSHRDLGARCIWLMPVAESPSYHGYDVSNYYRVAPAYGTNADFKRLVAEAHRRGIRVLVDLVLNHASSEHPFFKEALRDTSAPHRGWFRWSPTKPAMKGPWGQEVWHKSPVRDEYYYGVFWSGMPDLNYENPAVRQEANKVARFWLQEMGVDGFRLDAVPYLVERGDTLAHSRATHAVLHDFAANVRRVSPHAFTIGEVWDSTGTILSYYPNELDAHFAFPVSDAILEAVRTGSAKKLLPEVLRFQRALPPDRWAPFLRNHDQTRTVTALGGDTARARLAASLLLTLPGLPFVYYGEEIGMTGDKPDERLRTPMQWSGVTGAGFTRGRPWETLQPDSLTANVARQDTDSGSLLNLYRRLIHLRARNPALGAGELIPVDASSDAAAAWLRRDGRRVVLVLANLGTQSLDSVTVALPPYSVRTGRYALRDLLGGASSTPVWLGTDGVSSPWVPLRTLAPMHLYVLELTPARR
jgi:glycosidase